MVYIKLIVAILILIIPNLGYGAKPPVKLPNSTNASINSITKMESAELQNSSVITLYLSQKPSQNDFKLEDHGGFVQLTLTDTLVGDSGTFYDSKSPFVQKFVAFQTSPKNTSLRLFVADNAGKIASTSKVDVLGKTILITINHEALAAAGALAESEPITPASGTAEEVIQNTKNIAADPSPAALLQQEETEAFESEMQGRLLAVAIFSIVMLAALFAIYMARPAIRRRRRKKQETEIPDINTLTVHHISPKQKIAVVEVNGERLLLGITPNSINLLQNIDQKPVQQYQQLQSGPAAGTLQRNIPDQTNTVNMGRTALPPSYRSEASGSNMAAKDGSKLNPRPSPTKLSPSEAKPTLARRATTLPRPTEGGGQPQQQGAVTSPSSVPAAARKTLDPIDDVRKLIREKIKNLPQLA